MIVFYILLLNQLHDVAQVKNSFAKLSKVCCPSGTSNETKFLSAFEDSKWLSQVSLYDFTFFFDAAPIMFFRLFRFIGFFRCNNPLLRHLNRYYATWIYAWLVNRRLRYTNVLRPSNFS